MRLIHTADWHLGQTFYEYDRKAEHALFLTWLIEQVRIHKVDTLLIAGDVFDTPNPSADAQRQYYSFLKNITTQNPDLQIIVIAGNHDSAARLEAPNPLLEAMNVSVRGLVKRTADGEIDFNDLIIELKNGAYCLAVPYLRQGDYPTANTYSEGVQAMYKELFERVGKKNKIIIAMGHLQATGSEISQNDRAERTIIGGLESISPDAFGKEIAYTALGHLHRAQRVSQRENVRYAGAPLPMSFAEKNNKQGVTLVTITDTTKVERLEFEPPIKLLSIPKEAKVLKDVLAEIALLPDTKSIESHDLTRETFPFVEIKVLIIEPEPSLRVQIEKALEGKAVRLARIEAKICASKSTNKPITYQELQKINPIDMATEIFKRKYGGDSMPEEMRTLLEKVIMEVNR